MRTFVIGVGLLVGLAMLYWSEGSATSAPPISYVLKPNEHMIVGANEYRELAVWAAEDGSCILANGVPVYSYRPIHGEIPPQSSGYDKLNYTEIPYVTRLLADGESLEAAVERFHSKAAEFEQLMTDWVVAAHRNPELMTDWDLEMHRWLAAPENAGVIKDVQQEKRGYSYLLWSEENPYIMSTSLIDDSPAPAPPSAESIASEYIRFFASSEGPQVLVVFEGGASMCVAGQESVQALIAQVSQTKSVGVPVRGPLTERQLRLLGVLK